MQKINLKLCDHSYKMGEICDYKEANITEDCLFYFEDKPVGFYLKELPQRTKQLLDIANKELLSKRVPKSLLKRKPPDGFNEKTGKYKYKNSVEQYSTILGSCPPKPHMQRAYPTISRVHQVESAKTFIKAMVLLSMESSNLLKEFLPEQYITQKTIFKNINEKWKFGEIFTSSISNLNISAPFHKDTGNLIDTVNFIYTKRKNSKGGALHVPDYNITVEQSDDSVLVYPAWKNLHGVTPILPIKKEINYYRNSLIFYPLKAFRNLD
jgi:hypothetical protein